MNITRVDLAQLAERLRTFLVDEGWVPGRQARGATFYYAPEKLGIEGKYSVALPDSPTQPGVASLLYQVAQSLIEIYGYRSVGELLDRAASLSHESGSTRLITRFIDGATDAGAIPLASLASYIASIEAGLYRSAKFKLGDETKETKLIAQRFSKECLFLQTEQGSFVTKVEVPHSVLKQADLFGDEPLFSTEVCSSLFSAIQFLNENILATENSFEEDDTLENSLALFDVELLESLTKVLLGPEMKVLEFSLELGPQKRTSSTGVLSEDRKARLKDFFTFVREQLRGETDLDVSGQIVELRSRNPDGDKNYIRLVSQFHGDRTFISATLTNEQYRLAAEAHTNKRGVRLKGNAIRLKTQMRMTEIADFVII